MNRKDFIKTVGLGALALGVAGTGIAKKPPEDHIKSLGFIKDRLKKPSYKDPVLLHGQMFFVKYYYNEWILKNSAFKKSDDRGLSRKLEPQGVWIPRSYRSNTKNPFVCGSLISLYSADRVEIGIRDYS